MHEVDRSQDRPPLMRILDRFLQEKNIKWVLVLGMLILLGSSLMLVTSHWNECTELWKVLIMLGYTGLVWAGGELSYHLLGLRRTGTVMMALTILLIPVTFLALPWVGSGASPLSAGGLFALGLTATLAVAAARRVFRHLLRSPQPTFVASYLLLATAGATLGPTPPALLVLVPWGIFLAGSIKVTRHVFWLTEEHRLPRIFGFFPVMLLAGQFLALFGLSFADRLPLDWIGFGCALTAIPVLLAADSVLRVFEARTGGLVRPLPMAVIAPVAVALVLCAAGCVLTLTGLATGSPQAVTPTAIVVAALMVRVARRTGRGGFVWVALVSLTLAYNFTPVFFREIATSAVETGASAVRERKLPFAFYGLTYIPLLGLLLAAGGWARRKGAALLATPLRHFVVGLATLLLIAGLGHVKAAFPVAAAMLVVLVAHRRLLGGRLQLLPAVAAWSIASAGLIPFVEATTGITAPDAAPLLAMVVAAALLAYPGRRLDERRLRAEHGLAARPLCQIASAAMTLALMVGWLIGYLGSAAVMAPLPLAVGAALAALGLWHARRWQRAPFAYAVLAYLHGAAVAVMWSSPITDIVTVQTLLLIAELEARPKTGAACGRLSSHELFVARSQRIAHSPAIWLRDLARISSPSATPHFPAAPPGPGRWLARRPGSAWARSLAAPGEQWARVGLASLSIVATSISAAEALAAVPLSIFPGPSVRFLILAGCVLALARRPARWLGAVAGLALFALPAATLIHIAGFAAQPWLAAAWAALAVAVVTAMPVLVRHGRRPDLDRIATGVLVAVSILSLASLTLPARVGGFIGVAGLALLARRDRSRTVATAAAAGLTWQLLAGVAGLLGAGGTPFVLDPSVALTVGFLAAVSLVLWSERGPLDESAADALALAQRCALGAACGLGFLASFLLADLHPVECLAALATVAVLATHELRHAYRHQVEARVWAALGLLALGVAWLVAHGLVRFGDGYSLLGLSAASAVLYGAARLFGRRLSTGILARPFEGAALVLPAVVTSLVIARHCGLGGPSLPGIKSLALVSAAGVYLLDAILRRRSLSWAGAAVVGNVALVLLWQELSWTDPQLYLMPMGASVIAVGRLLRRELPSGAQRAIDYAGALMILVSPTFEIVQGSWLHMLTLMVASVVLVLTAIGFRLRALVFTGTGFLVADLVAMVVRGSIDHPTLLWVAGLTCGALVVTLGALAERHRESMLDRLRGIAATLETWS